MSSVIGDEALFAPNPTWREAIVPGRIWRLLISPLSIPIRPRHSWEPGRSWIARDVVDRVQSLNQGTLRLMSAHHAERRWNATDSPKHSPHTQERPQPKSIPDNRIRPFLPQKFNHARYVQSLCRGRVLGLWILCHDCSSIPLSPSPHARLAAVATFRDAESSSSSSSPFSVASHSASLVLAVRTPARTPASPVGCLGVESSPSPDVRTERRRVHAQASDDVAIAVEFVFGAAAQFFFSMCRCSRVHELRPGVGD